MPVRTRSAREVPFRIRDARRPSRLVPSFEEGGDLFGATVILASRIAANADGGEMLVAGTTRGLCSGKGFLFADRGEFVAKGFEEPGRISQVSWRDG